MNAAISASVVLASRLTSDMAVFSLILFSVQVFALFPLLRRRLQVHFELFFSGAQVSSIGQSTAVAVQAFATAMLALLMLVLTLHISFFLASSCMSVLLFITFVAPAIIVWAQGYKK
jgi:phosphatidylinositol N-acetylglucosaminyltransferase subunit C